MPSSFMPVRIRSCVNEQKLFSEFFFLWCKDLQRSRRRFFAETVMKMTTLNGDD